ncbi:32_t:CDS:2, partial [Acaulospora morrowiae]
MSLLNETYYDILEISETATIGEIKRQFHKLLLIYHPDKSLLDSSALDKIDDNDKVNRILEAWRVLKDPESRKLYDDELRAKKLDHDGIFNAEIDLGDMEHSADTNSYSTSCRCGGSYIVFEDDLDH